MPPGRMMTDGPFCSCSFPVFKSTAMVSFNASVGRYTDAENGAKHEFVNNAFIISFDSINIDLHINLVKQHTSL